MGARSLVIFVCGFNGTGKSTLARSLRAALNAIDTTLVEEAVERGQNVVVEGVLADDVRTEWMLAARQAGGRAIVVECVCTDEALHRQRVEDRWQRGESPITWAATSANRLIYKQHSAPDVVAGTVLAVEANLAKVLEVVGRAP